MYVGSVGPVRVISHFGVRSISHGSFKTRPPFHMYLKFCLQNKSGSGARTQTIDPWKNVSRRFVKVQLNNVEPKRKKRNSIIRYIPVPKTCTLNLASDRPGLCENKRVKCKSDHIYSMCESSCGGYLSYTKIEFFLDSLTSVSAALLIIPCQEFRKLLKIPKYQVSLLDDNSLIIRSPFVHGSTVDIKMNSNMTKIPLFCTFLCRITQIPVFPSKPLINGSLTTLSQIFCCNYRNSFGFRVPFWPSRLF